MFLRRKLPLVKFWKTSKKLTITESNFSNVAGTALLKSFSVVDIFLKILREFANNFPEENLQKAASAALIRSPFKIATFVF